MPTIDHFFLKTFLDRYMAVQFRCDQIEKAHSQTGIHLYMDKFASDSGALVSMASF